MRILYVTPSYKPAYEAGGPVVSISAAAEHLAVRGHAVTVFTTNANGVHDLNVPLNQPVMVDGVEVWYFQRIEIVKKLFPFFGYLSKSVGYRYAPDLAPTLKRKINDFDLVHVQAVWAYPTWIAGNVSIKAQKPLFYHQRGEFHPARLNYRSLKKRLYLKFFIKPVVDGATTLIALNKEEERNYRALRFEKPCRVIPNGVDVELYRQKPLDNTFRGMPISAENFVILFMGRLHTFKGADFMVETYFQIARQFPKSILIMAGPDEQGLISDLQKKVQAAGLKDRVFFPGMVAGDLKLDLLARADLFCLPSIGEGFSMAILEALASATPVLISPECNFPEVEVAGAGFVVERKPDLWQKAIIKMMQDENNTAGMGQRAFKLVSESYSWDKIVDQLEQAYLDGIKNQDL